MELLMGLDYTYEIEKDVALDELADLLVRASTRYPGQVLHDDNRDPYVQIARSQFDLYRNSDVGGSDDLVLASFEFRPAIGFITKLDTDNPPFEVDDVIDLCVNLQLFLGGSAVLL